MEPKFQYNHLHSHPLRGRVPIIPDLECQAEMSVDLDKPSITQEKEGKTKVHLGQPSSTHSSPGKNLQGHGGVTT